MILSKQDTVSTAQAVTASARSTDYIDLGSARDIGVSCDQQLLITVDEAATAAGAATVTFQLQCDDNTGFSSAKTVIQTDAIPKASLVVGYQLFLPLPIGLDERYVSVYYSVATGPLTAGKFSAALVHGVQKNKAYPDAI